MIDRLHPITRTHFRRLGDLTVWLFQRSPLTAWTEHERRAVALRLLAVRARLNPRGELHRRQVTGGRR